jgi:hypothetical protein
LISFSACVSSRSSIASSSFDEKFAALRGPAAGFPAREFFDLAKGAIGIEIVCRMDEPFAIERDINGKASPEARRAIRSKPLAAPLEGYMRSSSSGRRRRTTSPRPSAT